MQLIKSQNLTMSSREIAELVGSRHDDVKRCITRLASEHLNDDGSVKRAAVIQLPPMAGVKNHLGQTVSEYQVGQRESYIIVAQLCPEFTAKLVDRWQELEAKQSPAIAIPDFSNPAAAARAWAEQYEQAQRVTVERDHAIATKAEIGSRREATAMARASSAVREVNKLREELGFTSRHATILHVEHATGRSFTFTGLRQWCKENGVSAEVVPDKRFPKGVKAWPAGAWLAVYGINLAEIF